MSRILVTGGAGFVGSAVVDLLSAQGADVLVVDNLATGTRHNLGPDVPLYIADISDRAALTTKLTGERFDAVVHCAARTKVVESMEKPELYRRVIVDGTQHVLDVARAAGATVLVNFSSGGVIYGETSTCANEDRPAAPVSPYGTCKAEAEQLVARATGIRAVTLRPANIYGPRQRTDLEGGVVAQFMRMLRDGQPLTVRGDGTMERDYLYVGDVARAVAAALASNTAGLYNIGTGVATTINELVVALERAMGRKPTVRFVPTIPGELRRSCVDASRAAQVLGWKPSVSLEEGLRLTAGVG